jgi:hypothetical protein
MTRTLVAVVLVLFASWQTRSTLRLLRLLASGLLVATGMLALAVLDLLAAAEAGSSLLSLALFFLIRKL